jgi:hypothetical protein
MASASRQCGHHCLAPTGTRPTSVLSVAAYLKVKLVTASSTISCRGSRPRKLPTKPGFISETEQSKRLGQSLATRRRKQRAGIGPPYVRSGRQTPYPEDADIKNLTGRVVDPETPARVRRGRPREMRGAAP